MSAYLLPGLPYDYDGLEPYFDARTMELHHTRHHSHYVDKLNAALCTTTLRSASEHSINDVMWDIGSVPEESRNAVRNYGGGHANHSLFWTILSKDGGGKPSGTLADSLPNEDSPLTAEETPILGLDLGEHAHYLRYPAARADYVEAFWNVVNWDEVSHRFGEATRSRPKPDRGQ